MTLGQAWDLLAAALIVFGAWRVVVGSGTWRDYMSGNTLAGLLAIVVGFVIVLVT